MNREKIHKLLDDVLDLQEKRGVLGHPYVSIVFSNYGSNLSLYAMKDGFVSEKPFDYYLSSDFNDEPAIDLMTKYLEKLKEVKK